MSNRRLEVEAEERRLAAEGALARERHEVERRVLVERAARLAEEAAAAAAAAEQAALLEHEVAALSRQLDAQTQLSQELALQVSPSAPLICSGANRTNKGFFRDSFGVGDELTPPFRHARPIPLTRP